MMSRFYWPKVSRTGKDYCQIRWEARGLFRDFILRYEAEKFSIKTSTLLTGSDYLWLGHSCSSRFNHNRRQNNLNLTEQLVFLHTARGAVAHLLQPTKKTANVTS